MYSNEDIDNLLFTAENLATQVEAMLKNSPESLTELTLALNDFRMAQVQAYENIGEVLEDMEELEKSVEKELQELNISDSIKKNNVH